MYPKFVSLLGGAGLASASSYFVGVYLAFRPEWRAWAEFFVPRSIAFLAVPFLLLVTYLYLRTRLGHWYVDQGEIDEAIEYCRPRIEHNLLRGRKEALFHRLALARAYLVRQEYERVEEILGSGYAVPRKGRMALEVHRWRMEAALRLEDLVRCHRVWEAVGEVVRPARLRAYVLACRAELAARESDRQAFEEALQEALWADGDSERARLAAVWGAWRFDSSERDPATALTLLEESTEPAIETVPGREAGLLALRSEFMMRLERLDKACEAIAEAEKARADTRSEREVRRVRRLLDEQSPSSVHTESN